MTQVIKIRNLEKHFGFDGSRTQVLAGIDLDVNSGEMLAILGRSGSGKSTLLSIIGLLDESSGGSYQLVGTEVSSLNGFQQSQLRNRNIGWIFQNFNLVGDMTIADNVALPLRFNPSISKTEYRNKAMACLEKIGLLEKADSYPSQLSGGQQQRVAIARALITEPELLLCDEPTGNLDSENAELVFQLLLNLHKEGRTILLVTHDQALAKRCSRQLRIVDGQFERQELAHAV